MPKQTLTCTECGKTHEYDQTDGLPPFWSGFPLARQSEPVYYVAPDGGKYTLAFEVGPVAQVRPHVFLCPDCTEKQFPWI